MSVTDDGPLWPMDQLIEWATQVVDAELAQHVDDEVAAKQLFGGADLIAQYLQYVQEPVSLGPADGSMEMDDQPEARRPDLEDPTQVVNEMTDSVCDAIIDDFIANAIGGWEDDEEEAADQDVIDALRSEIRPEVHSIVMSAWTATGEFSEKMRRLEQ